jgi:hypothetical protein
VLISLKKQLTLFITSAHSAIALNLHYIYSNSCWIQILTSVVICEQNGQLWLQIFTSVLDLMVITLFSDVGSSEHNNGMLRVLSEYDFPYAYFQASHCYILREHNMNDEGWAMLCLSWRVLPMKFNLGKKYSCDIKDHTFIKKLQHLPSNHNI